MKTIVITYRAHDIHAHLQGNTGIWGCGLTIAEAVGNAVLHHPEAFGLAIEHDTVNPVPTREDGLKWERQKDSER